MKSNEERLQEILARLDTLSYVKPERIPNIDLYMDQVTTFMDEHLVKTKRFQRKASRWGQDPYKNHDQQLCQEQPASAP